MFRCFTRRVTQSRFPNTTVLAPYLSIRIFDYILALQCTATHIYTISSIRSSLSVCSSQNGSYGQTIFDSQVAGLLSQVLQLYCLVFLGPIYLLHFSLLGPSNNILYYLSCFVNLCTFLYRVPSCYFVLFNLSCFVRGSFSIS